MAEKPDKCLNCGASGAKLEYAGYLGFMGDRERDIWLNVPGVSPTPKSLTIYQCTECGFLHMFAGR